MDPHGVARAYDALADHWASGAVPAENGRAAHLKALQWVKPGGTALDVGCGSNGRLIQLLLDEGLQVEGVDLSKEMLNHARVRHPQVRFHQGDITLWDLPGCYDLITAWDSIWHVPLSAQAKVLGKLASGLHPEGVLLFTAGALDEPGEATNPCEGQPLYHATLGIPCILTALSENGLRLRHFELDQHPEKHLVVIAQKGD